MLVIFLPLARGKGKTRVSKGGGDSWTSPFVLCKDGSDSFCLGRGIFARTQSAVTVDWPKEEETELGTAGSVDISE